MLTVEFTSGKATFGEDTTKAAFEAQLQVKDLYGNVLDEDDYNITYSGDFTTDAGTYEVTVTGKGTNYAGSYDTATRQYVICIDSIAVSDVEKPFKNANYTIANILSDIEIESNLGTELSKDSFDITFGSATPKDAGTYTIIVSPAKAEAKHKEEDGNCAHIHRPGGEGLGAPVHRQGFGGLLEVALPGLPEELYRLRLFRIHGLGRCSPVETGYHEVGKLLPSIAPGGGVIEVKAL